MKKKKSLLSAMYVLLGALVILVVALLIKNGNFNDQSRASSGTILMGKLISVADASCTKCVEQCPGNGNVIRNCHPMESDGTSKDSTCNAAGRVEACGAKIYCCPAAGGVWTTDMTKCPGVTPPVTVPVAYRILKDGGSCVSILVAAASTAPLVGKNVIATGTLVEPYFYASKIVQNTCVQQCPGTDNVLRNCTPPEADGTSEDSICNATGRVQACGGAKYCCPAVGAKWTTDMTKCATPNVPPVISTVSLPGGYTNAKYSTTITATDTNLKDTLTMTVSGLPFGVSVGKCTNVAGSGKVSCPISGAYTRPGRLVVKATVSDNRGGTASKSFTLVFIAPSRIPVIMN